MIETCPNWPSGPKLVVSVRGVRGVQDLSCPNWSSGGTARRFLYRFRVSTLEALNAETLDS